MPFTCKWYFFYNLYIFAWLQIRSPSLGCVLATPGTVIKSCWSSLELKFLFRVVFNEVVQTTKDFMRDITVINPDWLCELAPEFYQFGTVSFLRTLILKRQDL